jgi:opacity protein-like surface antigen
MPPFVCKLLASHLPAAQFPRSKRAPRRHISIFFAAVTILGALATARVSAQAAYTASRLGDLQIGGGVALGSSNYHSETLRGFDLYSTFDFKVHYGVELNFRQTSPTYGQDVYERNYEVGGRYVYPFSQFRPYAKAMYGRGVFNYPNDIANLAYNLYSLGGGVDYGLTNSINLRADYEYQHWFGFPIAPLNPNIVTIGVAYHFSSAGKCKDCANRPVPRHAYGYGSR